jgi:hypothetical protein
LIEKLNALAHATGSNHSAVMRRLLEAAPFCPETREQTEGPDAA